MRENNKIDHDSKIPNFLKARWVRVLLYVFALGGLLTAGCWITIFSGSKFW